LQSIEMLVDLRLGANGLTEWLGCAQPHKELATAPQIAELVSPDLIGLWGGLRRSQPF
jgi:hypothetical protein